MYKSKNEIYRDYQIAIKLDIESKGEKWLKKNHYEELYDKLRKEHSSKLHKIEKSIENFNKKYPLSTGLFIEIPELTDTGEEIGIRHLVLEHESGIELFVMLSAAGITTTMLTKLVEKFGEKLIDDLIEKSISKLMSFVSKRWNNIMPYEAAFIEIRTREKGVMRERFEDFEISQLNCLIKNFDSISHLSELNQKCFNGDLIESKNRKSVDGTMSILQADD